MMLICTTILTAILSIEYSDKVAVDSYVVWKQEKLFLFLIHFAAHSCSIRHRLRAHHLLMTRTLSES